jgi:DNA-binding beta-propeller fold protein YncE
MIGDGDTKLYFAENEIIYQYSMSSANDLTSLSYDSVSYDVSGSQNNRGHYFNRDGSEFYTSSVNSDRVDTFTVATDWSLSSVTAEFTGGRLELGDDFPNISPQGITFSHDGTNLYVAIGGSGNNSDEIAHYTLSTGWQLTTATFQDTLDVSAQTVPGGQTYGDIHGIEINDDGTKLLVVGLISDTIFEYEMSTPYDLTTASYSGNSLDISAINTNPSGLKWSEDGSYLYVIGRDSSSNTQVYRYSGPTQSSRDGVVVTANAQAEIDTTHYKFGGSSLYMDGADDALLLPDFPALGTGEFTAECWIRFTDDNGGTIFDFDDSVSTGLLIYYRSDEKIDVFYGSSVLSGVSVLSTNTWYHIAVTRQSDGYIRLYIDGTLDATSGSTFTTSIGKGMRIGDYQAAAITFQGNLDEVRVSNTARYTAAFTAPTAAFENDADTTLLLHMNGPDGSTVFIDDNGVY